MIYYFQYNYYYKLNFNFPEYDGEYYEYTVFCLENYYNPDEIKSNEMKMKMMMKEFQNIIELDHKIEKILNNKI